jgi:proline dehydrogenase
VSDALDVCAGLRARGYASAVCFWDDGTDDERAVSGQCHAALAGLAAKFHSGAHLCVKAPALGYDEMLMDELGRAAARMGLVLHLDSLDAVGAQATLGLALRAARNGAAVGCTLPGRWRRSLYDAEQVAGSLARTRVVKGEWPDPAEPERDPRTGFVEVIDRLCGLAPMVAVATHDGALAAEALDRLARAGTRAELELLLGWPMRASLQVARARQVPVRVYVPFGRPIPPYTLSDLRRRPRLGLRLAGDAAGRRRRPPRLRGAAAGVGA